MRRIHRSDEFKRQAEERRDLTDWIDKEGPNGIKAIRKIELVHNKI